MIRLNTDERRRLEAWKEREKWTKEKSIGREFSGDSMPTNLVAPDVPRVIFEHKYVCAVCEYVSALFTGVHKDCPELPADREVTYPQYCYVHKEFHYTHERKDGSKVWSSHRDIKMVQVS